jgi:hypothetical protein
MPTGAHDQCMGTNERRLDMIEKRARLGNLIQNLTHRSPLRLMVWGLFDGWRTQSCSFSTSVRLRAESGPPSC